MGSPEPQGLPSPPASVAPVSSKCRSVRAELPVLAVELVDAFRNPITQIEFLYQLANAKVLEPVLIDAETAARLVLLRLGALVRARQRLDPEQPTRDGAAFARAALRTWPA